jgi:hypothetical protein
MILHHTSPKNVETRSSELPTFTFSLHHFKGCFRWSTTCLIMVEFVSGDTQHSMTTLPIILSTVTKPRYLLLLSPEATEW